MDRFIAWEREGTDAPCEHGTVGCAIDHSAEAEYLECEGW
jgi:hypothetical protein